MLTRGNDYQFLDFVNWVLQALLMAEEEGITKDTASRMGITDVFGPDYERMFINAVEAVGNYGEMYARHLEAIVPREGLNLINQDTGLIYSHPFGGVETIGNSPFPGGTLDSIRARGKLICGITGASELSGLGQDYCKALSAGIFGPDGKVEFVNLADSGFQSLDSGEIDALANAPVSLAADVLEPTTGKGFAFSQPYFYGNE